MIPVTYHNESAHRRLIADQVNRNTPTIKSLTLNNSSATTTVTDEKMGKDKTVILTPTNANAATESIYLSTKDNGSFVLTHSVAATTRTFDYLIVG